jgi:hypothetical protein
MPTWLTRLSQAAAAEAQREDVDPESLSSGGGDDDEDERVSANSGHGNNDDNEEGSDHRDFGEVSNHVDDDDEEEEFLAPRASWATTKIADEDVVESEVAQHKRDPPLAFRVSFSSSAAHFPTPHLPGFYKGTFWTSQIVGARLCIDM